MADRTTVVRLRAEVEDYKRAMKAAGVSTENLGKSAAKSEQETRNLANMQVQAGREMEQETRDLANMQMQAGREMDAARAESAQRNREAMDKAGTALLGFGVVAVAGLGMAAKAALDWESQWAGVLKTVNGSDAELGVLEDGLRDLAKTLPSTHQEIAAVAEAAGQLGVQTGAVVGFTKVMVDLGETTNLSADEAATSIAQMMNVMGTAPEDVGRLGASLVALGNAGASTERDIISMAQRLSGAGALVGASEDEVLALANAMASMGIEAELGGGAMSRTMLNIYGSVKGGTENLDKFAEVAGMTAAGFAEAFEADPIRAVDAFTQGLDRIDKSGGNVMQVLGDLGIEGTQDLSVLLRLKGAGDLLSESLDLGAQSWAENTALVVEAGKRYDTTEAKIQIAKNGIADTAITIGETFLPMLATAAGHVSSLAEFIGGLPKPLLDAATGLGAVGGAAALAGGAFLVTFPRVMDTVSAFKDLKELNSKVATGLGKVGKAAGAVGVALGVATAAAALFGTHGELGNVSEYTKGLLDLGEAGADIKLTGFELRSLDDAFRRMTDPSAMEATDDWFGHITQIVGVRSEVAVLGDEFDKLGQSLVVLYDSSPELAAAKFQELLAITGGTAEELLELMPAYATKLQDVANAEVIAGEGGKKLADGVTPVTAATEEAAEALEKWMDATREADASFIGLGSAWDAVIQKNTDVAQSTADATKKTTDSWEDYYDGVTVGTEQYLKDLEAQVKAQQDWETNMLILSGRVSQGVIDHLMSLGPEGAAQVALMTTMTDAELARMETAFGQRSENMTTQFAGNLKDAGPVIAAAGAQLGEKAANEIAHKLALGEITVQQAIDAYHLTGVEVPVDVDTDPGQVELDAWIAKNNKIHPNIRVANGRGGTGGITRAEGGSVTGPGSGTSDDIPAWLSNGEHVFTASDVEKAGGQSAMYRMRQSIQNGDLKFAKGGRVSRIKLPVHLDTSNLMDIGAGGSAAGANGTSANLVAFGRLIQGLGFSVGEHPAFGGVRGRHMVGSKHYSGRAIDVNKGAGTSRAEQVALAGIIPLSRKYGLGSIFMSAGHYNHAHFEAYRNGGAVKRAGVARSITRATGGAVARPAWQSTPARTSGYATAVAGAVTAGTTVVTNMSGTYYSYDPHDITRAANNRMQDAMAAYGIGGR